MTAAAVAAALSQRLTYADEMDLHGEICTALAAADIWHRHEVRLSDRDRIDLLTSDGVGIEVKVAGPSLGPVLRQLTRYSQHDEVRELVLVTTQARHGHLPTTVGDNVPLLVHSLLRQGL